MSKRNYTDEKNRGLARQIDNVVTIREAAQKGELGRGSTPESWILIARALSDCPLPYRPTKERQIVKQTRIDGRWVTVAYTAAAPGVGLPYGMDDRLKHWLIDRCIQQARRDKAAGLEPNRTVGWNSIYEYLEDLGLKPEGDNYRRARESFKRLAGLAIAIRFETPTGEAGKIIPFLDEWHLPKSIDRGPAAKERAGQQALDIQRYGFTVSKPIFEHAMNHFVAIPRQIWRMTKRGPQQHAMLIWAFTRAYAAQGPSLIPWDALREQFWYDTDHPERLKTLMKTVAKLLHTMWPGSRMTVEDRGVSFDRATAPLLEDDPLRGRQRKQPPAARPADARLAIARDELVRERKRRLEALQETEDQLRRADAAFADDWNAKNPPKPSR